MVSTAPCKAWLGLLCLSLLAGTAAAHDGESHTGSGDIEVSESSSSDAFPFVVGGDFSLVDHHGNRVTNRDFEGKYMLVYFGYVNCQIMCSTNLHRIAASLDTLGEKASELTPLVITVDPARDTPDAMKNSLGRYHPALLGLTGTEVELKQVYEAYKIRPPFMVETHAQGDPIISHSSYLYLLGPNGEFKTLFPPILPPAAIADIMRKYMDGRG